MQHKWVLSDGSVATWTQSKPVHVAGQSELAIEVERRMVRHTREPITVPISPFDPREYVKLDLSNVWLVDRFVRNEASRLGLYVNSSTYEPKDDDMGSDAESIMERVYTREHKRSLAECFSALIYLLRSFGRRGDLKKRHMDAIFEILLLAYDGDESQLFSDIATLVGPACFNRAGRICFP